MERLIESLQKNANFFSRFDDKGHENLAFGNITNHRKDNTVWFKEEEFIMLKNIQKKYKLTTHGWQVLLDWKDKTTT